MVCVICEPVRSDDPLPPPTTIERTTAHASTEREYRRRTANADHGIDAGRGPSVLGRVMKLLADEPASTTASVNGVEGERRLTRLLDTELVDAVALHDRKVPTTRGNLDHLVIAPSGIWLIDARRDAGEVECRSTGVFGSGEPGLFVDGRNQTRPGPCDGLARGGGSSAARYDRVRRGAGASGGLFHVVTVGARELPVRGVWGVGDVAVGAGGSDRCTRLARRPADRSGRRPPGLVAVGLRSTGVTPRSR